MARRGRRRWRWLRTWRPTWLDLGPPVGFGIILYEVAHEGRLGPMGVGLGMIGYRWVAPALQISGKPEPPLPLVEPEDEPK